MAAIEIPLGFNWASRWPHFTKEELFSPDGLALLSRAIFPYSAKAIDKLEAFRIALAMPLIVNNGPHKLRGFRSPQELIRLYPDFSNRYSFHLWCAFDISCPGMPVKELFKKAIKWKHATLGEWGGIGLYPWGVHIDDREADRVFWDTTQGLRDDKPENP